MLVIPAGAGAAGPSAGPAAGSNIAPSRERIAFAPHPKTLTSAGDYEYFAAQGKAPVAFAFSDLIGAEGVPFLRTSPLSASSKHSATALCPLPTRKLEVSSR